MVNGGTKILISLDSLLDTRLGVIAMHDITSLPTVIKNGYYERTNDSLLWELTNFTKEEYLAALGRQSSEVFKWSHITPLLGYISEILKDMMRTPNIEQTDFEFTVEVNAENYQLDDEAKGVIVEAVRYHLPMVSDVSVVNLTTNALSPSLILAREYDFVIDYNLLRWLSKYQEELTKTPLREVTFLGPKIFHHSGNDVEESDELVKKAMSEIDPFMAYEFIFSLHAQIRLVEVSYFSSIGAA